MDIQYLPIKDLIHSEKNPRKITREQMAKLELSLKNDPDFLIERPVLVNKFDGKNYVYAGHQRIKAAKKLGWKEIPCSIALNVPDEVIKARKIKDNKTFGSFDYDLLIADFDLPLLIDCGFTPEEIKLPEDDEPKPKKEKQLHECPKCGFNF